MSHNAAKKLKPCPFCGDAAYLRQCPAKGFRAAGTRITFQVGCMNRNFDECPLRPAAVDFSFPTEQAAIEAWNKRSLSSRDAEVRAVLEGLGKSIGDTWCWCSKPARDGNGSLIHFAACLAARALWEKVQER